VLRTEGTGKERKMKRDEDRGIRLFLIATLIVTAFLPWPSERFAEDKPEEPTAAEAVAEYRELAPLYDVPLATEIQRYIMNAADYYGIEPALVLAVIEKESQYNAAAIGDGGDSIGLMQIQPRWHTERMDRLGANDLFNPYDNVSVGINILAEYIAVGNGETWALMAYSGGAVYANKMAAKGKVSSYAQNVIEIKNRILSEYKEEENDY